jgi:hypothetical protein
MAVEGAASHQNFDPSFQYSIIPTLGHMVNSNMERIDQAVVNPRTPAQLLFKQAERLGQEYCHA